ncbi:hypothetical protein N180_20790 [Pedobacter antarcticus 4BY]|uniref:Competence protein ComEA n=2 Tax=Pedobacter antarcticus TaxID=34086 RepID=A0A081PDU5_9SPHI|nr:helix-hairpin-helix domain-containing protein [Pedobacter antarcticus]KEQ28868.1 hypothetical protein N180_20790 [Pedobacter antarcticus 4BY]SFF46602.1 DNA uptake protein ComE [Pedobacter antarcticus]
MRKWLKIYFGFNAREKKGILLLLLILMLLQFVPYIYEKIMPEAPLSPENEKLFVEYYKSMEDRVEVKITGSPEKKSLFVFDPNTLDEAGWMRLGLSKKQAMSVLNYRSKGGVFREKEELKKMYTISPGLYERLFPYIKIAVSRETEKELPKFPARPGLPYRKENLNVISLNDADSLGLLQVKGIGPVFAGRILKYRERLGGFVQLEQLLEVFGMDSLRLNQLSPQLAIDTGLIRKIAINKVSVIELRLHPYIGYKQAQVLAEYRKQHGNYINFASLSKVIVLSAVTLNKIAPYISFEYD